MSAGPGGVSPAHRFGRRLVLPGLRRLRSRPSSSRSAGRARIAGDDPDAMAASIAAYETAGVQHVVLALNTGDVDTITRLMETIAREVVPRFL